MIKILVNDGMKIEAIEKLKKMGLEVIDKHYVGEELEEKIKEVDVIIVRSATKVRKNLIDEALKTKKLKLVVRGGVGLDNIDVEYAEKNNIKVLNTPNASSVSVAELTIAHMFALSRFVYLSNLTMREGKWEKKKYQGIELAGKTLGLIGFGRIAKEVAKRAQVLGMKVIYNDKLGELKEYKTCKYCNLQEVLKQADFVSLHIPFCSKEGATIGKEELKIMKKEAYIINCARGGVIDEKALLDALNEGEIAGAGLDVFENEPNPNEDLVNHPKVSVTPHIGGTTKEAQERIGEEIVKIVEKEFLGGVQNGNAKAV
ncbi:D-2-hydroxyacid dehydrogenase [Haloimpatiens sp. FM7330]|uniref:D-2-hydroxyacid dehydrogenase n=1 Tax=Haloimpatiens sp. FM7330 TaxID=3298610 RepID=UPI00362D9183